MKRIVLAAAALVSTSAFAAPFELDQSHMEIGFSVKHLMISNVKGRFDKFDGKFDYDPAKKVLKDLDITIQADSVNTQQKDRDDHLRSPDFFDAKKFPKITFRSNKVTWDKESKEGKVDGTLTIKDASKPVTLNFVDNGEIDFMGTKKIAFTATTKISRADFGLKWNKTLDKGGVAVGDEVNITIDGEGNMIVPKDPKAKK